MKKYIICIAIVFIGYIISNATDKNTDKQFSVVENPNVPKTMTFAGVKVNFDRADMYERIDRELTSLCYTHGNTMLMIKRANKYFPILAPILKKNGIPEDLLYLACVESVLNIRAYSPAKAAGLWQFIASTGKQYGLEINDYVDERYNIEKATEAACRYLKKAYNEYGNWESVASSYNGGRTRITKELASQQVTSSYDLYLVDETTRYMFRILATKLIMENPQKYGFRLQSHQLYQPIEYDTVTISTPIADWPTWAKKHKMTYAQLKEMNPWIRAKSLPNKTGKSYIVKVTKPEAWIKSKQKKQVYNPNWVVK